MLDEENIKDNEEEKKSSSSTKKDAKVKIEESKKTKVQGSKKPEKQNLEPEAVPTGLGGQFVSLGGGIVVPASKVNT